MVKKLLLTLVLLFCLGCVGDRKVHFLEEHERDALNDYRERRSNNDATEKRNRITPGWLEKPSSDENPPPQGDRLKIPESQAGTLVDNNGRAVPTYSVELFAVETERIGDFAFNIGGGHFEDRMPIFVSIDRKIPSLLGVEIGIFVGYDVMASDTRGEAIWGFHIVGVRW